MTLNQTTLSRLSLIKYLFEIGLKQSRLSSPQNSISLLMFHDSIELFLQLCIEFLNVSKSGIGFMTYFKVINQELKGNELSQKSAMNKLNRARVNLKHYGMLSKKSDIETFRVNAKDFFEDNTKLIFYINFSEISMIELVQNNKVRKILKNALNFSKKEQYKEALEHISIGFNILLADYDHMIFDFEDLNEDDFEGEEIDFSKGITKLNEILEKMQFTLKLSSLNIDNTNYIKFHHLTPALYSGKNIYGKYSAHWSFVNQKEFNQEQVNFCLDFIIDCALKLQEYNSDLKDLHLEEDYQKKITMN